MIGPKRRTVQQWADALLAQDDFTLEEFVALEAIYTRLAVERTAEQVEQLRKDLDQLKARCERTDGRLERLELFMVEEHKTYPLTQQDIPDLIEYRRRLDHNVMVLRQIAPPEHGT
jgi:type II secretory pathway component PulJ